MLSTAAANRCVSAASLGCRQDFRRNWLAKSKAAWLGVRSTRQRCGARVEAGKREEGETAGKRGEDEQSPASSRPGWNEEAQAKAKWLELLEADADKDPAVKELLDGVEGGDFDEVEKRIRERFEQKKERIYKVCAGGRADVVRSQRGHRAVVCYPLSEPDVVRHSYTPMLWRFTQNKARVNMHTCAFVNFFSV